MTTQNTDSKQAQRAKKAILLLLSLALGASTSFVLQPAAGAQPSARHDDYFSATQQPQKSDPPKQVWKDNPAAKPGSLAMMSADSPEKRWFEMFDRIVIAGRKTPGEYAILGQSFNMEAERVQRWINTATGVAKRYRSLAQTLQGMYIPEGHQDLADYRDITASWFSDAAGIYEDMTVPRQPYKTKEELQESLDGITARATALKNTWKNLYEMDIQLRRRYGVHLRTDDDPLQKYVKGENAAQQNLLK